MTNAIQIMTATGSREEADAIAEALLAERLAACVQVWGPVTSRFWWEGKIDRAQEWLCLVKTRKTLWDRVEQCIRSHHGYATPEILALPVWAGARGYLAWLAAETAPDKAPA